MALCRPCAWLDRGLVSVREEADDLPEIVKSTDGALQLSLLLGPDALLHLQRLPALLRHLRPMVKKNDLSGHTLLLERLDGIVSLSNRGFRRNLGLMNGSLDLRQHLLRGLAHDSVLLHPIFRFFQRALHHLQLCTAIHISMQ